MPEDLDFQEAKKKKKKKIKAPVLNGIYLKKIKILYLQVSLKAGFIERSHHQHSNIWRHPNIHIPLQETPLKYYLLTYALFTGIYTNTRIYTWCPRRNVPDFGRVFLMLKYTDITQNTYVQS